MARTLLLAAAVAAALLTAAPAHATTVYATSGDKLWTKVIPEPNPVGGTSQNYSGLQNGEQIVALDYDPAGARLFGLGRSGSRDGLYEIDPATATATRLTADFTNFDSDMEQGLGFDFNPAVANVGRYIQAGDNESARVFSDTENGFFD